MCSVPMVVNGIVVVIQKIPADQVVSQTIAVLVRAVLPGRVGQQVSGVNESVAVAVRDMRRISWLIQIDKRNQTVGVSVRQDFGQ